MARRTQDFQTIRSEGGLLPQDLLRRVLDPHSGLPGTTAKDYHLAPGERLNEVITQSWNRLRRHWDEFRQVAANLPAGAAGTGLTNDKWSLPLLRELGFGFLPVTAGPELDGRTFPIRRFSGPVPIHLLGCGLSLDRRAAGQHGAAAANPHGLVQEFLNRSDAHLWAIVSNGLRLRVLRDNQALSRQSFLDFDLEAMFSGEVYSDFVLLWLMEHATRFMPRDGDRPETCRLEQWTQEAERIGTRALGVSTARRRARTCHPRRRLHRPSQERGVARSVTLRIAHPDRPPRTTPAGGVPADLPVRRGGPHARRKFAAPSAGRFRHRADRTRTLRRALRHRPATAAGRTDQGFAPHRPLAPVPVSRRTALR